MAAWGRFPQARCTPDLHPGSKASSALAPGLPLSHPCALMFDFFMYFRMRTTIAMLALHALMSACVPCYLFMQKARDHARRSWPWVCFFCEPEPSLTPPVRSGACAWPDATLFALCRARLQHARRQGPWLMPAQGLGKTFVAPPVHGVCFLVAALAGGRYPPPWTRCRHLAPPRRPLDPSVRASNHP